VCDLPHDEGDDVAAFPVTITTPDGTWSVDVCAAHAEHFLFAVIGAGRAERRTRARRPVPARG
jgi:hypothetical protein